MKHQTALVAAIIFLATIASASARPSSCTGSEKYCHDFINDTTSELAFLSWQSTLAQFYWDASYGGVLRIHGTANPPDQRVIFVDQSSTMSVNDSVVYKVVDTLDAASDYHDDQIGSWLFFCNTTFANGTSAWNSPDCINLHEVIRINNPTDSCFQGVIQDGMFSRIDCLQSIQGDEYLINLTRQETGEYSLVTKNLNTSEVYSNEEIYLNGDYYVGVLQISNGESTPWTLDIEYYKLFRALYPPVICTPDWDCTGYSECSRPATTASCNSVIDRQQCGTNYTGNYSEFTPRTCTYESETSAAQRGEVSYCDQSGKCYSSLAEAQAAASPTMSVAGIPVPRTGFWDTMLSWISPGWKGGGLW